MSNQPANCRERLMREGKPYPRSGCAGCNQGLQLRECPHSAEMTVTATTPAVDWTQAPTEFLLERGNIVSMIHRVGNSGGENWGQWVALMSGDDCVWLSRLSAPDFNLPPGTITVRPDEKMVAELATLKRDHAAMKEWWDLNPSLFQHRIDAAEQERDRLNAELEQARRELAELRRQLSDDPEGPGMLGHSAMTIRDNYAELQSELTEARKELASARNDLMRIRTEMIDMEDARDSANTERDKAACEYGRAQIALTDARAEIERLKMRVVSYKDGFDGLDFELHQLLKASRIPEGWQLVPIKPDGPMEMRGATTYETHAQPRLATGESLSCREAFAIAWAAALSAAPSPPANGDAND